MGTKVRSAVVAGLLGLLAACSEQGTPAADGPSDTSSPATSTTESSAPAGECPSGTYQVDSITAKDGVDVSGQDIRVADVKGLTLEFADGTWTLTGKGATISVSASGLTAGATLDGTATGDYAKSGDSYAFEQKSADGKITLDQPIAGVSSIPMSEFGPAVAPSGTATITCTDTGATITAENATLELTGGSGTGGATGIAPGEPTSGGGGGAPAPAVLNSSAQSGSYTCNGGPVTINGSNNQLTFVGECKVVTINGSGNKITVESAGVVSINGGQNRLTWIQSEPRVTDNGRGNTVTQG
jgi:hypothetical protein